MKRFWPTIIVLAVLAGVALYIGYLKDQVRHERMERFNAEAAGDRSRMVWRDANLRVTGRLAFQQTGNIELRGELRRILRGANQKTEMLVRLQVQLDSLAGVVRSGTVTLAAADSTIRQLAAALDTAGYHIKINADVPAPPASATVRWTVTRDPVEIIAALNRDSAGRRELRALAGPNATARIDTVRVQVRENLQETRRMAGKLSLVLLGVALVKVLEAIF